MARPEPAGTGPEPRRPEDTRPSPRPKPKPTDPEQAGLILAREHAELYPLTDQQIESAARILAAVARERQAVAA